MFSCGFSVEDGVDPEDGDCVTGTPDTFTGVSVVAADGIAPVDGDSVAGLPERPIGSCVVPTVGTEPDEGDSVNGRPATIMLGFAVLTSVGTTF